MPNRIIKETICTSEEINSLDPATECFFYRLMVNCDDHGLMDARPAILKSKCYPLRDVHPVQLVDMLNKMLIAGLVECYMVKGRPYLHIVSWEKHQQIRAKRAKYPKPDEADDTVYPSAEAASDINGNQPDAGDSKCPRNPIQSKSNQSIVQKPVQAPVPADPKPKRVRIGFDYDSKKWTGLADNESLIDTWLKAYPGVSLRAEFSKMRAWLASNPSRRKTDLEKFANNWLSKAQDRVAGNNELRTFAERKQDFLDNEAKRFYQPLAGADQQTLLNWGLSDEPKA